jgi:hypothetical protein
MTGAELTIAATKGDVLSIATDGTSFTDIVSRLTL